MDYQSSASEPNAIVTGDSEQGSEQGNMYVTVEVINELREKNAIQSTNYLFKASDKKNTEMSGELKTLKGKVNKRFGEKKDLCKRRNELLDFLHERIGNLDHRTKLLGNEIEHVRDDFKEEHELVKAANSAIQSIKDFLKNSGNRITEISNEVKTLKENISDGLLVKTETFW